MPCDRPTIAIETLQLKKSSPRKARGKWLIWQRAIALSLLFHLLHPLCALSASSIRKMYASSPQPYDKHGPEAYAIPVPEAYAIPVPFPPASGHPTGFMPQHYPPNAPPCLNVQSHRASVGWSTGLCHCCDDPANCLITCCCPCITFGQVAEIVDKGSWSCAASGGLYVLVGLTLCPCLYSCFYRSKLRAQYDLEETPCTDCLVHVCCEHCALCQEYRELKNRGFDMGIGWEANVNRRNRGVTAPPEVIGGMTR